MHGPVSACLLSLSVYYDLYEFRSGVYYDPYEFGPGVYYDLYEFRPAKMHHNLHQLGPAFVPLTIVFPWFEMAASGSTVVEHSTYNLKIAGLNPAAGTGREKLAKGTIRLSIIALKESEIQYRAYLQFDKLISSILNVKKYIKLKAHASWAPRQ